MPRQKQPKLAAIVGRPNVGKSTLFNKLIGYSQAIASNIPGTTRDVLYGDTTWNGVTFTIADTAGLDFDNEALQQDVMLQTQIAADDADLIIFLVDVREGLQVLDQKAAELIRKLNKPVVLATNKTEGGKYDSIAYDFHKLGLGEPMLISAVQSRGVGDLLDKIVLKLKRIKKTSPPTRKKTDKPLVRVALLGRPNVGKSTLFNQLIGKKRAVTSNVPGTTRDTVAMIIETKDFDIELIDTAGIRRPGKISGVIEKFSYLSLIRALRSADIALLLLEANEGIIAQDLHITQLVLEENKGLLIVVNKWDALDKDSHVTSNYDRYLARKFAFANWVPHLYISALTGQRVDNIKESIGTIWASLNIKIPTKALNNIIADAYAGHPPVGKRTLPKIYFASQREVNPPTILLKTNRPEEIHFSYLRYLEKKVRDKYPMVGAPLKWQLIKSSSKK
ncbi:ribosome biogenesis GTPase Der [Patescibacteria group bacterium]|nr:ribosome biogenesis GTPase Der [Patescibacteria group bacterium]